MSIQRNLKIEKQKAKAQCLRIISACGLPSGRSRRYRLDRVPFRSSKPKRLP